MIDVKQLRIGSHVEYDGMRVEVQQVSTGLGNFVKLRDTSTHKIYRDVTLAEITPISLTAELLQEMGFEKRTRVSPRDRVKDYYIDAESAKAMEKSRLVIPQIELSDFYEIGKPEFWQVRILSTPMGCANEDKMVVRYLHELESFVYLTIGKDLVK